jgi:hypothetical protein
MKPHALFTFLALLLAISLAAPAVSATQAIFSIGEIATVGEETTVYLVLDSAPEGLSGYNVNLTLSNSSVAQITNITFPAWAADMNAIVPGVAGQKILVKASDVNNNVGTGATNIALAAITVKGLALGSATISLSSPNFDNENGSDIPVTLTSSAIAVNTTPSGLLPYDARLVLHTIPGTLPQNRNITVSLTVNNTGRNPWMLSSPGTPGVYLAAVNSTSGDAAKFGFVRMDIPENTAILAGREYTFTYGMQVPNETGSYSPAYQLESDSAGPFGPVFTIPVAVVQGEPAIRFTAPVDDNYTNETVIFNGTVRDPAITSLVIAHNGINLSSVNVIGGNFSGTVVLNANDELTASAYGGYGFLEEATLRFDGDRLPGSYEQSIGFDPQNPDSDNAQTVANEANNGIPDGYEKLDGKLPVFVKYRLGADPFRVDTDNDDLTDEFELTRLGLTTNVTSADTDNNGVTDAYEDADNDGLTNLVEQTHGSDPLVADSDGDSLTDADEINTRHTNPVAKDTDNDALDDDSEIRLGTNPLVADSNGNSVPDGNETFVSARQYFGSSLELSVTGIGDAVRRASVSNVNYTHLIPDTILVSNVSAIAFGNDTASSVVRIHYFPEKVGTPANLSMFVKNETSGSFDSLPFTLDAGNKIVSSTVTASGEYCVMDKNLWDARFESGAEPDQMAMRAMASPVTVSYSATKTTTELSLKDTTSNSAKSSVTLSAASNLTSIRKPVFIPDPTVKNSPLIYGIDYGPVDPKAIRIDKNRWDLNTSSSANPNSKAAAKTTTPFMQSAAAGSGQTWEAVENGDFSQGLVAWMPNTPAYGSDGSVAWEVDTDTSSYTSSPPSLRLKISRLGSTTAMDGGFDVAHANIDTLHASQLTFRYRCTQATKDPSISAFRFELLRKTSSEYTTVWEFSRFNTLQTGQWSQPVIITLNPEESLQTYKFRLYYGANAVQPRNVDSYATVLIDDVSVISSERPRQPTDANIRFRILNSANGQPITAGMVYVQKATELLQSPVKSDGTTENFLFESPGTYPVEVYSTGYTTLQTTISVTQGQTGTYDLYMGAVPPQTGTINVYSNPTGAEIFVDGTSYGPAPRTINNIPVGSHTLTAKLSGYDDLSKTVTVNAGTSDIPFDLIPKNSDPDTMPDIEETGGYKDPYGTTRTSNPALADTDGDGLTDDYEAGDLTTDANGHTFRKMRSNPLKVDSDDDGLDDAFEDYLGTDALSSDTDNDGLKDVDDPDPLVPLHGPLVYDIAVQPIREHIWTEQGLIFGETGIRGGTMNYWVGDEAASSGAYFAGWMTSGYFGYGDVRDTTEALYQHDTIGASLNALGVVPLLGDGGKSVKNVRKVVVTYPAKAAEMGTFISRQILPYVPDDIVKLDIWDICYNGAGRRLVSGQVTAEHVLEIAKRDVDLSKVEHVVPLNSGKAIPVQVDDIVHYEGRHVTGDLEKMKDGTTLFPTTTRVEWDGKAYPGTSSLTQVQMKEIIPGWIDEALKVKATEWPKSKKSFEYTFSSERYGVRKIEVAVDQNGVYSVYPLEGSQVYKWYNNQWNSRPFTS